MQLGQGGRRQLLSRPPTRPPAPRARWPPLRLASMAPTTRARRSAVATGAVAPPRTSSWATAPLCE
eukprot:14684840-Alexandrium_andersonii.AAC.1